MGVRPRAVQAFYTYAQLADWWQVRPDTVANWVRDLRRDQPSVVHVTYRLVRGHRRTAYLSAETALAVQTAHFPEGEQSKRRGSGLQGSAPRKPKPPTPAARPYLDRRLASEQAERAALRTAPPAPARPPVRKLVLPAMPSRDGVLAGGASRPSSVPGVVPVSVPPVVPVGVPGGTRRPR